jgi:hypothetical protein
MVVVLDGDDDRNQVMTSAVHRLLPLSFAAMTCETRERGDAYSSLALDGMGSNYSHSLDPPHSSVADC